MDRKFCLEFLFLKLPVASISFQVEFTGLKPNTLYYYKAYVTINTAQVYSQNAAHFTTKQ